MNRARNKVFRLDATRLSEDDSLVSVCIPYWFRRLLLDTTERYLWSSVWREANGQKHELTEEEEEKIAHAIYRLTIECQPEDLDMEINVSPIITVNGGGCGCGDCEGNPDIPIYTPPNSPTSPLPIPPVGDQPPPVVVVSSPPIGWEQEAYNLAKCAIANYGWSTIYEWLTVFGNIRSGAVTIVAVLLFLSASAPALVLAVFGANFFLQLIGFLVQLGTVAEAFDDFIEDLKEYFVTNRQDIICAGYNALDEVPLYESLYTSLLTHMQAIWDIRAYNDELIALLTNVLEFAFPSSVFGLLIGNADPEFFATYTPPLPCDCGTGSEGDAWEWHFGIVAAHTEGYTINTEADHNAQSHTVGAGAGSSYQQAYDALAEFWETSPDELPFTAVHFIVNVASIVAPAGNSAERAIRYGGVNNDNEILAHTNAAGVAVAESLPAAVWVGVRLSTHAPLGTDIEFIVPSKAGLMPQFNFYSVGYLAPATDWEIEIEAFTMVA